jgi:hypothetical protein
MPKPTIWVVCPEWLQKSGTLLLLNRPHRDRDHFECVNCDHIWKEQETRSSRD